MYFNKPVSYTHLDVYKRQERDRQAERQTDKTDKVLQDGQRTDSVNMTCRIMSVNR